MPSHANTHRPASTRPARSRCSLAVTPPVPTVARPPFPHATTPTLTRPANALRLARPQTAARACPPFRSARPFRGDALRACQVCGHSRASLHSGQPRAADCSVIPPPTPPTPNQRQRARRRGCAARRPAIPPPNRTDTPNRYDRRASRLNTPSSSFARLTHRRNGEARAPMRTRPPSGPAPIAPVLGVGDGGWHCAGVPVVTSRVMSAVHVHVRADWHQALSRWLLRLLA